MSIEDRSLDASKEEGTATVIDGSDDGWNRGGPFLLHSKSKAGYLHIDSNGSLRADGDKGNSDHDTGFKVHSIETTDDQIVILQHCKTKKVVAIDVNKHDVITKDPPENLNQLTNLDLVKEDHPDILFFKIPKPGGVLFCLKSFLSAERFIGFNADGSLKKSIEVVPKTGESLLQIFETQPISSECPNT